MLGVEAVGELREDSAGQRDVAELDLDAGRGGVGAKDREQRLGRERRRLIGLGVDDLHGRDPSDTDRKRDAGPGDHDDAGPGAGYTFGYRDLDEEMNKCPIPLYE